MPVWMPVSTAVCRATAARYPHVVHSGFTTPDQDETQLGSNTKEKDMNDHMTKDRNRKLVMLGGLGLGLAMLGRKRRWRRYAMGQMMGGGFAGAPWGRFGGYGHGGPGGPTTAVYLQPLYQAAPTAQHC